MALLMLAAVAARPCIKPAVDDSFGWERQGYAKMLAESCTCGETLDVPGEGAVPTKRCRFSFTALEGKSFQLNMSAPESAATLELVYKELVTSKYRTGLYRLPDIQRWNLQPGDVVIDVGANLGFISILAAMAWPSARVYSFEANPLTHALLAENVRRNGVEGNTQANNLALSSDGRNLSFFSCSKINIGRNGIYEKHLRPFSSKDQCAHTNVTRVVRSATLKSILTERGISSVAVLKLDCEGCEFEVLPQLPVLEDGDLDRKVIRRLVGECHKIERVFSKQRDAVKQLCTRFLRPVIMYG